MTTQPAKKRPGMAPQPDPKRSGTHVVADRPRWPASLEQDLIPTQPENEEPLSDDEIRDTLPAPPPDEE